MLTENVVPNQSPGPPYLSSLDTHPNSPTNRLHELVKVNLNFKRFRLNKHYKRGKNKR